MKLQNNCPYCGSPISQIKYLFYSGKITCLKCGGVSQLDNRRKIGIGLFAGLVTFCLWSTIYAYTIGGGKSLLAAVITMLVLQTPLIWFFGGALKPVEKK